MSHDFLVQVSGLLFEIVKQWFLAYQHQFLLGLVLIDCRQRLLEYFFLNLFLKETTLCSSSCFSNLFSVSARLFCSLSFAKPRKILSKFSKRSAILKHRGKFSVTITSIVHLSSNRSQARINQNSRITWVTI